MTALAIESMEAQGFVALTLKGDVDMAASSQLREALQGAFERKPKKVIVVLRDVRYIDSSGLAVLIEALRWSKKGKVGLALATPSERVVRVLELAKLHEGVFEILKAWEPK